ncbi:hypothetical protein QM716_03170 [Rhodococcus sp. IEGM 1409]|uniref:hypothetical protein n=1 Tax=Rhodococcus sp. IEGM 1409 TaxID=3047082 RepID=UPI0024B75222|nr:hypothetical protein [Rhodococcus sp. IEGM 1409]MDI9898849.1 hypothetical protein [Rhodococcus sp. IEGM 1409]
MIDRRRRVMLAGVCLPVVIALASCTTEPESEPAPNVAASLDPSDLSQGLSIDPVALIRADPEVSDVVKDSLRLCGDANFPYEIRYSPVTDAVWQDAVVNVFTCESLGAWGRPTPPVAFTIAGFVYQIDEAGAHKVFEVQDPGRYVVGSPGGLSVMVDLCKDPGIPEFCQSSTAYRWTGEGFESVPFP